MTTSIISIGRRVRPRAVIAGLLAAITLSACGSASDDSAGGESLRIVSLSPTATEMLYAIGAGDLVVAVDSLSTHPAEVAPKVTKISAYEPSAEAIIAFEPDLVVISDDMNGITAQLLAADPGIEVWQGAAAEGLDDVWRQITELGDVTGRRDAADELVDSLKERITAATEGVVAPAGTSYYYELDDSLYSLTSETFVGALLAPFGMVNIADGVEAGNTYPQLNAERLVQADPDVIFLADTKCCGQSAATVTARPGWSGISAVVSGNIVELDDDVASRWGPRIVELLEAVSAAVKNLAG
ncbi:MAG: hypothetical protein RL330_549 [Actinomycetota bacterium]|jgi:iron complex transport system substrate-binding protein